MSVCLPLGDNVAINDLVARRRAFAHVRRLAEAAIPWRAVMPADHIVALRRDSNRIALGVEGRLNQIVPSCPGWQVADLVWHVGIVHMFWRLVARGVLAGPEAWSEPDRPDTDDLLAWFAGGVDVTATSWTAWTLTCRHGHGDIDRMWASSGAEWPRKRPCTAGMPSTLLDAVSP